VDARAAIGSGRAFIEHAMAIDPRPLQTLAIKARLDSE
jgi:hypothetical protein